ncbi:MAG: non-ribosomal peptide synthetase [Balneolaceae bacterium]
MSEELRTEWLVEWNNTGHPYPVAETVSRLFETRANKHGKKTALTFDGGKLSYSALNKKANRLAHYLKEKDAGRDKVVAICLKRSPELIVSILAALKSGAAYLPLDPDYPAARLSYMMEDAHPVLLITESQFADKVSAPKSDKRILADGEDFAGLASYSDKDPEGCTGPDDLAYILYTSGSTGQPKGTMVHQRGMLNYLSWAVNYYGTEEGSGSPLHSSIGFDATLTSFFTPLLSGRTLHLLPNDGVEIEHITACLTGSGKKKPDWSLVKLTPSHMELLNELIPDEKKAGLTRSIVLGGEALTGRAVKPWRKSAPKTRIINEYGPTETVVGCAIYEEQRTDPGTGPVPIGRPIWNTRLYVLDRNGYPVPPGVEGELYIGGDGVARGYLNRPDLTKERFIDIGETGLLEVDDLPAGRLYRTGDRVKLLADGNLVFLGRYDNQLKLRGYRIEPAEIEGALVELSGVREAVVMLRENSSHQFLVAYIVTDSPGDPGDLRDISAAENSKSKSKAGADENDTESDELRTRLRTALRDRLPEHMIPSHFVLLGKIPLNKNGKVDYPLLPDVSSGSGRDKNRAVSSVSSPRGDAEQRIASIWCDLLELARVGRDENFFDVGGHSLLVLPLRDRLASEFKREIIPADIFQYTTVASMAKYLAPAADPFSGKAENGETETTANGKLAPAASGRKARSSAKRKKKKDERRS